MLNYSKEDLEDLIKKVYSGEVTEYDLPEDLYLKIGKLLQKGVEKGFGDSLPDLKLGTPDYELLAELRENVWIFSGAKTFSQIAEMTEALTNGDAVVSFKEFKKTASGIFKKYNQVWLETEYNTAIGQSQNALSWNRFENEKDVLPMLRYSSAGSENVCDICRPLDGLMAPVDDAVWSKIMPMNHFGCVCIVEQKSGGRSTKDRSSIVDEVTGKMNDVFKMNPGKDKVVFSESHPYFEVAKKYRDFAKTNFGLDIPDNKK